MNEIHQSYRESIGNKEDFRVKYKFRSEQEGARKSLPSQGIRSDFWYECDNHTMESIFMIWPEFEDEYGELIVNGQVRQEGTARMWIVTPEMKAYHQSRIKIGTQGYFMEGSRRTADCEVIEIVSLTIK